MRQFADFAEPRPSMDIAPLLAPVNPDTPGGVDLSFSPEIDAIQEMRREDDPTLDQGEWVATLKTADWPGVARTCEAILTAKSKDLRVSGWLADAWARLRGFDGLADGLDLTAGLVENWWDQLHPLPEEGDQEQRIGNLRWLAARVDQLVPAIPLVVHVSRKSSLADIGGARAKRLAGNTQPVSTPQPDPNAPPAEPVLTLEMVWRDVTASGREAARTRREHVTRARTALARLQAAVDARLADDAPSFVAPRGALDKALDELARLERECNFNDAPVADAASSGEGVDVAPAVAGVPSAPRVPGRIETRAQALEQLRLVAAFFRSTEPHSPVAYLADKAVRWSEMPLHEWLRAVVKDGGSLSHLEEMLGVQAPGTN
jgi:type VI secretion system protein ImpA